MQEPESKVRPFPIQGNDAERDAAGRMRYSRPSTIPWWLAEIAYESYVKSGGRGQSLERLAERGGFGRAELVSLLRREFESDPGPPTRKE